MTKTTSLGNGDERREKLMKILRSQPDDVICRRCLDNLEDYVASQLAGEDYLSRFADMATHLDGCPECAGAYARVYELELADSSNQLLQPDYIPEPDLSFLNPQPLRSQMDLLKQAIRQWSDGISFQLTTELLQWLRPSPMPQLRKTPTTQDRFGELILNLSSDQLPELELPVSVAIFMDTQNPKICMVELIVASPGRSWPNLEGSKVTLKINDKEKTTETDHNGLAAFTDIPIDALDTLQINVLFAP